MNKERRAALGRQMDALEALRNKISEIKDEVESIKYAVEEVRDNEQEALDNLPDSFRDGEKGQDMEAAVSSLDDAVNSIEELFDTLDGFDIDGVLGNIDDARGQA